MNLYVTAPYVANLRVAQLLAGTPEEVLEERSAAGGDDTDEARAEDRAVDPEVRGEFRGHHRGHGTAGDLRHAQVDPFPFHLLPGARLTNDFGPFTHTWSLPAFPALNQSTAREGDVRTKPIVPFREIA
ncbi:hypothetical protein [Streptomyces zaehneri]|uniref:hypothetical protein n=1 Tax=Streptomyces zaehneri TaxID=3051180 RepID=UPI0028D6746D|nr:hypothetical protein [Streptomyces sp. DSM 40713]